MTGSRNGLTVLALFLFMLLSSLVAQEVDKERKVRKEQAGLVHSDAGAFVGYTLFAPLFSNSTYMIDMKGRVVHQWESDYQPGQSAYLLKNGHLLRTACPGPENNSIFHGGGAGGKVQEFTWEGELVWDFEYSSEDFLLHHDIEKLPNGNVLMIAWEKKSPKEAFDAGRNPERLGSEGLWPDCIIEVEPTGIKGGKIVWEWHAWDHLVQELDRSKPNFGKVADHPERINLNPLDWESGLSKEEQEKLTALGYLGGPKKRNSKGESPDFMHTNSIAYNAELDQIMLSVLGFNEIWIIDHSTTIQVAAGHSGGKYGKGGDLLFRWGNPKAYASGSAEDQRLFSQHDATWIEEGLEGAGHILVFNNGRGRPGDGYSSVDEIIPPMDDQRCYQRTDGSAFGPARAVWSYSGSNPSNFYSTHISGAQRLPNGNTLICSGERGKLFEVTPDRKVVWEYVNPVKGQPPRPGFGSTRPGDPPPEMGKKVGMRVHRRPPGMAPHDGNGPGKGKREPQNCVFRAYRYAPDYPGLAGKELTAGKTVEELLTAEAAIDEKHK